jgi:teichoic acid transport system permease protein
VPFIVWMMAGLIPWLFIRPTILDGSTVCLKWINVVAQPVQCLLSRLLQIYLVNFVMMSVYVAFLASGVYPWIQYISYLICMIVFMFSFTSFGVFSAK